MLKDLLFFVFGLMAVGFAGMVAFHPSLVHAVLGLLGTLVSVACLYGLMDADFVAVTQVIVYVGGVVVLFLFGVFLTKNIGKTESTNLSVNLLLALPAGGVLLAVILYAVLTTPLPAVQQPATGPVTGDIGRLFLTRYLLVFEVLSLLLLAVLVGALLMARREVKPEERDRR